MTNRRQNTSNKQEAEVKKEVTEAEVKKDATETKEVAKQTTTNSTKGKVEDPKNEKTSAEEKEETKDEAPQPKAESKSTSAKVETKTPVLVKHISATIGQIKFYKVVTDSETGEFLGVGVFSLPHQADKVVQDFEKKFNTKVSLHQPASLQLNEEDMAMIGKLLRPLTKKEIDKVAYNLAFGRMTGDKELNVSVRLS